jgi:hypothetical protein
MEWMPGAYRARVKADGPAASGSASNQQIQAFRGPCSYAQNEAGREFVPQWVEFEKAE